MQRRVGGKEKGEKVKKSKKKKKQKSPERMCDEIGPELAL